jgi:hypothetical protein
LRHVAEPLKSVNFAKNLISNIKNDDIRDITDQERREMLSSLRELRDIIDEKKVSIFDVRG